MNGSVVVVRWKPCTASLFTIYHREMLSEGKSHWKAVNVSRHETSYDLHLGCQKEHEIAVTAWNSTAETPLTAILKHGRIWRMKTFGGENTVYFSVKKNFAKKKSLSIKFHINQYFNSSLASFDFLAGRRLVTAIQFIHVSFEYVLLI